MFLSRIASAVAIASALVLRAELPLARLHSIFPPGGQRGTTLQVTAEGADLDDASRLHFSTEGISSQRSATNPAGSFTVTIASNVPPGIYETRVVGRFGISNPRFFTVGDCREFAARNENRSLGTALHVPLESTVNSLAPEAAADFYKFDSKEGESVVLLCQGEPFDSKMNPALVLFDSVGREIRRDRRNGRLEFKAPASGTYILKVHDLQYRGGNQFPYRLTFSTRTNLQSPRLPRLPLAQPTSSLLAEARFRDRSPQEIHLPCEIEGRFPTDDFDIYRFAAKKGQAFWIEVVSERTGQPTDPFVLIQKVSQGENRAEKVDDVLELYDSDTNLGGAIFNTSSRDPSGRLEIKEDGTYQLKLRDLFKSSPDLPRGYHLSIHPESPDFQLIALVVPPPNFDKEKREGLVWSLFLRRNDTLLLKILALRREGFAGEIALHAQDLPPAVRASDTILPAGQSAAWLSLSTDDKSVEFAGPIKIAGSAKVGDSEITRYAAGANVIWNVPDYNNESVHSRLSQDLALATSPETVPISIEGKQAAWQTTERATLSIPLRLTRSSEFKQPVKMRAYLDTQADPLKEWQVDGGAAETTFDLDVGQGKITPGLHHLFFLAQTNGKMRRVRPEEVAALETAAKQNEVERKKVEERLQLRDVNATFSSPIMKIIVNPATTAAK